MVRHFPLIVLVLALMTQGCAAPTGPDASGEIPLAGTVLYADDFNDPPSGWGTYTRDGAMVDYHSGGLRIQVNEPQYDFWSVAGKKLADVQIEVDAMKIGGPDDNDFGLICRYGDEHNFYMLVISSDGYYGIAQRKDGIHSMIGADQLQYSSAIAQGQAANHLRADCVGNRLALYANGVLLMEAQDTDFTTGDVGLLAGAFDRTGVDILFDNFVVKRPGE